MPKKLLKEFAENFSYSHIIIFRYYHVNPHTQHGLQSSLLSCLKESCKTESIPRNIFDDIYVSELNIRKQQFYNNYNVCKCF